MLSRVDNYIMKTLFAILLSLPLLAVAATPTPAQMEMFKSLSPEQQREALEALKQGKSPSALSKSNKQTQAQIPDAVIEQPIKARDVGKNKGIEETSSDATDQVTLDEVSEEKATKEQLSLFGYDLFAGEPTTFAPVSDIPVPLDYTIGPGDTIIVQMYGKTSESHELQVTRDGEIYFPKIGPMAVAGLTFAETKKQLLDLVDSQFIGVSASITLGAMRSIRIFVLGEAYRPGSYTVSALTTMTNALFVSGGITKVGSLRRVQLKRRGKVISEMDLYDLLLNGDTSKDARLSPGDVIFIPPIGKTAAVSGEVRRPAIYEMKGNETVQQVVNYAGGLLPTAFPKVSHIERISSKGTRTLINVDVSAPSGREKQLKDGDVLSIFSVLDKAEDVILLSGHVQRPGGMQWYKGIRVSDVIRSFDELLPNADLNYALIKRESKQERTLTLEYVDLRAALSVPRSNYDLKLQPRDEIMVFSKSEDRRKTIQGVINTLTKNANHGQLPQIVEVQGNVKFPGQYPYHSNMTVSEMIYAAGGLKPQTEMDAAVLQQTVSLDGTVEPIYIPIGEIVTNKTTLNAQASDVLFILNESSERSSILAPVVERLKNQSKIDTPANVVSVTGPVRFPGDYPLISGMNVDTLIKLAGGLKENAHTGSIEITTPYINVNGDYEISVEKLSLQEAILNDRKLKSSEIVRFQSVPNWTEVETVRVAGEVRFPGTYVIAKGESLAGLINRAGGLTEYADPSAAVFTRESLRRKQQQQLDEIRSRFEKEVALKGNSKDAVNGEEAELLIKLQSAQALGRLIIDLPSLLSNKGIDQHIELQGGDLLAIPRVVQEVSIIGEVNKATSHLHREGLTSSDYISMSGGFTSYADEDRVYVIKASGLVASNSQSSWFSRSGFGVEPGDTIVVPVNVDPVRPMQVWKDASQILFQLATTVAALEAVGVF